MANPVDGTSANNTINGTYVDAQGDRIDSSGGWSATYEDQDTVLAGDGIDNVTGGVGHDTVDGGAGNDTIQGGVGDDTILGQDGDDTIYGDLATNNWYYRKYTYPSPAAKTIGLNAETAGTLIQSGTTNTPNLIVGDYQFVIFDSEYRAPETGAYSFQLVADNLGMVTIYDKNGNVVPWSDGGNYLGQPNAIDFLTNETRNINLVAGEIYHIEVRYGESWGGESISLNSKTPTGAYTPVFSNPLFTAGGSDTINGGAGNDTIYGQDGHDVIDGGIGIDILDGGKGNDTIFVSQGDTATGGDGDDTFNIVDLLDGTGTITITGGEGAETTGDTLNLFGLGELSAITYTNTNDAAGGLSGFVTLLNGTLVNFSQIETITNQVCFTRGSMITTDRGEIAVEELRAGDLVMTMDRGLQPIRWIGSRGLTEANLEANPKLAPVTIKAGAMGRGLPNQDLRVSPQHRMLLASRIVERMTGEAEILTPAIKLVGMDGITQEIAGAVEYFHILFDRHEVIYANGTPAESLYTGAGAMGALSDEARAEIFAIFPELADGTHEAHSARVFLDNNNAIERLYARLVRNDRHLVEM